MLLGANSLTNRNPPPIVDPNKYYNLSFSKWDKYNQCPHLQYLTYTRKEKGLPVHVNAHIGKKRGQQFHLISELFFKGHIPITHKEEFAPFAEEFIALYKRNAIPEHKITVPINKINPDIKKGNVVGYLDIFCEAGDYLFVGDVKTGKYEGNQLKHYLQAQLYALMLFILHPEANRIEATFFYVDHGITAKWAFTRDKLPIYMHEWNFRSKAAYANDMTFTNDKWRCKHCSMREKCKQGIEVNG
jgi:hypothetical protein